MPMRSAVVRDVNGDVCATTEAQNDRWRRHCANILNMQSEFDMKELERVKQSPLRPEMAELSTEKELLKAIVKLNSGKAGGESNILPEMIVCIGGELPKRLLELVHDVWKQRSVPRDWCHPMLIPIP